MEMEMEMGDSGMRWVWLERGWPRIYSGPSLEKFRWGLVLAHSALFHVVGLR